MTAHIITQDGFGGIAQSDEAAMFNIAKQTGAVWLLRLNDMRAAHIEEVVAVAYAEDPGELRALIASQRVEPYTDDRWRKSFAAGGPLEWFNAPDAYGREFPDGALVMLEIRERLVETGMAGIGEMEPLVEEAHKAAMEQP